MFLYISLLMDFLLVPATGLTAVVLEKLGVFMDIFQMSLSGSLVTLNPPPPYVLN